MAFADAAPLLADRGWTPLPIPYRAKTAPPEGTTGSAAPEPTPEQMNQWIAVHAGDNVAVRMPAGVIGIDVDNYGTKTGGASLEALIDEYGPLPDTWISTSRTDGVSGIRFYRVPVGVRFPGTLSDGSIETVQRHHRYALVSPSIHPEGRQYMWVSPEGETGDQAPEIDELADLPWAWIDGLHIKPAEQLPGSGDTRQRIDGEATGNVTRWILEGHRALRSGSRHDNILKPVFALVRLDALGYPGASAGLAELEHAFIGTVTADGSRDTNGAQGEWDRLIKGAEDKVAASGATATPYVSLDDIVDFGSIVNASASKTKDDADAGRDVDLASSWMPIDLRPYLDGEIKDELPSVLHVPGHDALFYPGRMNSVFGEPGGGKSWVAVISAAEQMAMGNTVVILDWEDTPKSWISRLRAIGATNSDIDSKLRYVRPNEPFDVRAAVTLRMSVDETTSLLVVDSTGEALSSEGVNPNADEEVARWFRRLGRLVASWGPCVLLIDHVPKSQDASKRFAIGSQRKLASIDGAAYRMDVITAFSKETAHERAKPGKLKITVAKDRHGTRATGVVACEIDVTPQPTGQIDVVLSPAATSKSATGAFRPTHLMEKVSRWLELNPGATKNAIRTTVTGNKGAIEQAIDRLDEEGFAARTTTVIGGRERIAYTSVRPFREDDDEWLSTGVAPASPHRPSIAPASPQGRCDGPSEEHRPIAPDPPYYVGGSDGAMLPGIAGASSAENDQASPQAPTPAPREEIPW